METRVTAPFADGDYDFWLPMSRVVAAEREMGLSIFEAFHGLGEHLGQAANEVLLVGPSPITPKQCRDLIRNALIGGDTDEQEARELVETYCYPARPAIKDMALAWKILEAAIYGISLKKKDEAGSEADDTSPSEKVSSSPAAESSGSTGTASPSADTSKPAKRTKRSAPTSNPEPSPPPD